MGAKNPILGKYSPLMDMLIKLPTLSNITVYSMFYKDILKSYFFITLVNILKVIRTVNYKNRNWFVGGGGVDGPKLRR